MRVCVFAVVDTQFAVANVVMVLRRQSVCAGVAIDCIVIVVIVGVVGSGVSMLVGGGCGLVGVVL